MKYKLVIGAPLNMLIKRITLNITLCDSVLYHSCLNMRKSVIVIYLCTDLKVIFRSVDLCRAAMFVYCGLTHYDLAAPGPSIFDTSITKRKIKKEQTKQTLTCVYFFAICLSKRRQKWSACTHCPRQTKRRLLWHVSLISPASVDDDRDGKWPASNLLTLWLT